MAIEFRGGFIIGLIGPAGAGEIVAGSACRRLGPADELDLSPVDALFLDHALALRDAPARMRAFAAIERLRRGGAAILLASHEQELLLRLCDEIWWLDEGRLAAKGDPREILDAYNRDVAARFRRECAGAAVLLAPSLRRGDGRAELLAVEIAGEDGRPTSTLRGGEMATVQVRVRFAQAVADPVVGILIRTRVGMEVYGTNTELEGLKLGPRQAGDTVRVEFRFPCHLCPREYTLTAASHDPDGVWHDWAEDAVAFSVADSRYTAGVANLRAAVAFTVER
jgi:lipopolysaccharide transport system ATP-binding protein